MLTQTCVTSRPSQLIFVPSCFCLSVSFQKIIVDTVQSTCILTCLNYITPFLTVLHTWQIHALVSFTVFKIRETQDYFCRSSQDIFDPQYVFLVTWCPSNISELQVWSYESGKKQFHALPIQELVGSPNETKRSVCSADLLLHVLGKCQVIVHKYDKVLLNFCSGKGYSLPCSMCFRVTDMFWVILCQVEYLPYMCLH